MLDKTFFEILKGLITAELGWGFLWWDGWRWWFGRRLAGGRGFCVHWLFVLFVHRWSALSTIPSMIDAREQKEKDAQAHFVGGCPNNGRCIIRGLDVFLREGFHT